MIPEMSRPTSRCPHPERWHAWDDMATEVEVLAMISYLVNMLKPSVIVETGCYTGYGTVALEEGLIGNGDGHIYTCDLQSEMVVKTRNRVGSSVSVEQCMGAELIGKLPVIDFAFLDSGGDASVRADELRLVIPKLSPWGVVVVHDTGETHPDHREAIEAVVKELDLAAVFFDTPRGVAIIRRKV